MILQLSHGEAPIPLHGASGEPDSQSLNLQWQSVRAQEGSRGHICSDCSLAVWLCLSSFKLRVPAASPTKWMSCRPSACLLACQIYNQMMYEKVVMFTHCKKLFKCTQKRDAVLKKTNFYPLCSLPSSPNPVIPWTLKTGGLRVMEVIFFQAVKALKSELLRGRHRSPWAVRRQPCSQSGGSAVPTFLPSPYIRGNFKSSSSMVLYAL